MKQTRIQERYPFMVTVTGMLTKTILQAQNPEKYLIIIWPYFLFIFFKQPKIEYTERGQNCVV